MSRYSPIKKPRLIGSVASLAAFIAFSSQASAANAKPASDTSLLNVNELPGVTASELRADGSVVLTFEDGSIRVLSAAEVIIENGAIFIDTQALDESALGGGADPVIIGLGLLGLVGAGIAIAGGGDDDDEAPAVNAAPVITSPSTLNVAENETATGFSVVASDQDNDPITFSIVGGDDADLFAIDPSSGALTFLEAQDFDTPGDANGDNTFEVQVEATDGNSPVTQLLSVTLDNINDNAPVIISGPVVAAAENSEEVAIEAQDADGDALTFSLTGTDAALFAIDAATGVITFLAAPDFENPDDANGDNIYDVIVTVTDGENEVSQSLEITVTDQVELVGTAGDDVLVGTDDSDVIDALDGDDVIASLAGSDQITTGPGSDRLVFAGDPFEGTDVSADGRQIVGGEDFISDFDFAADSYQLAAEDFGVSTELSFVSLDASAEGAEIPAGANVIVLLNSDNDGDPDTPFLAGTAAAQIASLVEEPGPGFFVYWNSNLGVNRLVYSTDLSSADADLKILSRQTDLTGQDAIEALASFTADNFTLSSSVEVGTDNGETITATDGDDLILALAGDDIIESLEGSDDIATGAGNDVIAFAGEPFEGADVSEEGRQIVGGEDFVRDFAFGTAVTTILVNEAETSQAVVDAADAGNIYFNIHSSTFPAGEVRGNLTLVEDLRDTNGVGSVTFSAVLNGANEVPAVDTEAEGTGTVTFTIAEDGTVTYTTEIAIENFDIATLTVGHFHEAPVGENGPVVVDILADARADGSIEGSLVDGDLYQFDAGDLGINAPVNFVSLDANAEGAAISAGANVIVLLNRDNDGDASTPFLAGTAAAQIAGLVDEPGPGIFVYWNSNLGVNRLVYSTDLSDPTADLKVLSRQTDLTGPDAVAALADFTSENFRFVGDGTAIGTEDDDNLVGTTGNDVIDAGAGDDVIDSLAGLDTITTGAGDDTLVFAGDPFEGTDVSADGRQIVGGEDVITDFDFAGDLYQFNSADFDVGAEVNFVSIDATQDDAEIPSGSNVIVLLNADNDSDASTPFLAGTAAAQIASLVDEPGAGFFVYWNSNLGVNRLVYSTDLSDPTADLTIISRQTDLTGPDAIAALGNFSADNFAFVLETSGEASQQAASVDNEQVSLDTLFADPLTEDELASIAQANADAAAGGL